MFQMLSSFLTTLCFSIKGDGLFIVGNMSIVMMGVQLSFLGAENTYPKPVGYLLFEVLVWHLLLF